MKVDYLIDFWFLTKKQKVINDMIKQVYAWCSATTTDKGKLFVRGTAEKPICAKYFFSIESEEQPDLLDMWDSLRIFLKKNGGYTKHRQYGFDILPQKNISRSLFWVKVKKDIIYTGEILPKKAEGGE